MIWLAVLVPALNLGNVFQIVLIVVLLLQIPEPEAGDVEPPKENAADDNERYVGESSPGHLEDPKGETAGRTSSSGSSSSDSGSSSSDTDTDSSSADGSDAAQSPRT
jgi:hypothetical protein